MASLNLQIKLFFTFLFIILLQSVSTVQTYTVPTGGNSWVLKNGGISTSGFTWSRVLSASVITYVYFGKVGNFSVSVNLTNTALSNLTLTLSNQAKSVNNIAISSTYRAIAIGNYNIDSVGYIPITINIFSTVFASGLISSIILSTDDTNQSLVYVSNNDGSNFYWGRRGPSCHLNYKSKVSNIAKFYSEITVPVGYDTIGSFFMANGCGQGYFGIQVNSQVQRRVLFSIWTGYTGNLTITPDDWLVKYVKVGPNVTTNQFSGEGTGGQSYLKYNWTAGTTYRFLLQAQPQTINVTNTTNVTIAPIATIYTAYFYSPTQAKWRLIASWKRPYIQTYLTSLYSFVQNYLTDRGNITRKANYGNQWVQSAGSQTWTQLIAASYSVDGTGSSNLRRDFQGGIQGTTFYLQNTGFFNTTTKAGITFTRTATNIPPSIDLTNLL